LIHELLQADLILTPTRRLASSLKEQLCLSVGTGPIPETVPLTQWLQDSYLALQDLAEHNAATLITGMQEKLLWFQHMPSSVTTEQLEYMVAANSILHNWQIPISELDALKSEQTEEFLLCRQRLYSFLRQNNLLLQCEIVDELQNLWSRLVCTPRLNIVLFEFSQISPLQEKLFTHLVDCGCKLVEHTNTQQPEVIHRYEFKRDSDEIGAIIDWLRTKVTSSSEGTYAVVVPNLVERRSELVQAFTDLSPLPYNVSAPIPLNQYPMIQAALFILRLDLTNLSFSSLSFLLRCPFLQASSLELIEGTKLEVELRNWGEYRYSLDTLIAKFPKFSLWHKLQQLQHILTTNSNKTRICWLDRIIDILTIFSWPGTRTLDSDAMQLLNQWYSVLEQYQGYQFILQEHDYPSALNILEQICNGISFLPKSEQCQIQVLGVLEAAGLSFTGTWLMGFNSDNWPAAPNPNPYIPLALAKKYATPRSSTERELRVAKAITATLLSSATEVITSNSALQGTEERLPSALFKHIELQASIELKLPHQTLDLQPITDTTTPYTQQKLKGGTRVVYLQSACPFQAFVSMRLNIKPLATVTPGLSPARRGELVHAIMRDIWAEIKDSHTLANIATTKLDRIVGTSIEQQLSILQQYLPNSLTSCMLEVEQQRLYKLINKLLAIERLRPTFKVKALESSNNLHLCGLDMSIRIDRVDELADGSYAVFDYKTSSSRVKGWFGERPQEPQLPLYSLALTKRPSVLGFVVLKANEISYVGLSATKESIPGITHFAEAKLPNAGNWQLQHSNWYTVLSNLVTDFQKGHAIPLPRDGQQTCRSCSWRALCHYEGD